MYLVDKRISFDPVGTWLFCMIICNFYLKRTEVTVIPKCNTSYLELK